MSETTRSSPFLETPMSPPQDLQRQVLSLQYQLNTLTNDHEIDKLALERQLATLDKKYRHSVEDLDKALSDTKYLYETNQQLETELKTLREQLSQANNEKDTNVYELKQQLLEKNMQIEELETASKSRLSIYENRYQNSQVEAEGSKNLLRRYEEEIDKQSEQIKELLKTIAERDDELATVKAARVVMAHHNYSTEELQELTVLNKTLKDQMSFSKELERANLHQANELKRLKAARESHEFLKSENETLRSKVEQVESLNQQIQDLQLENIRLQQQLTSWEIYDVEGSTPQEIIRELKLLRQEKLSFTNENSKLQLNINNMKVLNDELALERNQLLDLNKNYENSILNLKKLNYEIEQQKLLSFEECKLLRKQLNDLVSVEGKEQPETVKTLENIVDGYKSKTEDLTNELRKLNDEMLKDDQSHLNKKRKTSDDIALNYSQRLNELQILNMELERKFKKATENIMILQDKINKLSKLNEKKIRVLQLRDSPLLKDQFVKKRHLDLLKEENMDLLVALESKDVQSVPKSVYECLKFELKQLEEQLFASKKKAIRLKEVFNHKSLEFIDAVNSLLGFKLEFQPNGNVKLISCFKPEKYLIADLANNTLKSNLNTEIDNWDTLLQDLVREQAQIPCFLATVTLKLWEKYPTERH